MDPSKLLTLETKTKSCALYSIDDSRNSYVVSTAESRSICNDPFVYGLEYTKKLAKACSHALTALKLPLKERETNVVHLLRGGLNFGLREALGMTYGWNRHGSSFLSAQRQRCEDNPEEWEITECEYQKLDLPKNVSFVLGDVVASGASLKHGLLTLLEAARDQRSTVHSIVLFTIGGPRTRTVVRQVDKDFKKHFPKFQGTTIVYLEGRFPVAAPETELSIKLTGTDLLRHGQALAPEFIESQYKNSAFPLERCTIYDAGSRAFDPDHYLRDVLDYWKEVQEIRSLSFAEYLEERCPSLDCHSFPETKLPTLAKTRIKRLESLLK